MLLGAIYN
ncbi:hypothetical protein PENPOL_c002G10156 [Penicillium polonicum]|uniref:Uncharacterized protein n=1 Tax=Penicillium polonicum TaxID=60169 RepID=A0A1V6NX99_PENPO|nr:hypothetical protein PENPOL_c002G10156 [Penicillium polonicum]